MPELRKDPVTGRWVIISTDRQKRPNDFRFERANTIGREQCPFCPGHEQMTPHEVMAYRENGTAPNAPGWDIRVVPNKFPALQVEGSFERVALVSLREGLDERRGEKRAHDGSAMRDRQDTAPPVQIATGLSLLRLIRLVPSDLDLSSRRSSGSSRRIASASSI